MNYQFSSRVQALKPSAIREIFKYSADPSYIPLSAGNPAPDAFPKKEIAEISSRLLSENPVLALQYSFTEGYPKLRDFLKEYMKTRHGSFGENDELIITSGAQQIADLLTKSLVNPGDVVLCEAPSFIGCLNTFRSYEARLVGIELESDGVNLERLEQALRTEKNIRFFYVIPNFQNPSGVTTSMEKRKKIYDLCKKHGVIILEDNPYGDLRFKGEHIMPIKSLDTDGIVVYAGSFSKVISPGMRVGYAIGPAPVIQKMVVCKQGEDVHSNIWAQAVCHEFISNYDFDAHLERLCGIYKRKSEVLISAMEAYFSSKITWNPFEGGLFAWCNLPENVDMRNFCMRALEEKVCVVPGNAFLADEGGASRSFRINFSTPSDRQLEEGIKILGKLV